MPGFARIVLAEEFTFGALEGLDQDSCAVLPSYSESGQLSLTASFWHSYTQKSEVYGHSKSGIQKQLPLGRRVCF